MAVHLLRLVSGDKSNMVPLKARTLQVEKLKPFEGFK
jgi:hypothetical protein